MSITFNASTHGDGNGVSGSTTTITKPTVSAGDILIAGFGINEGTTAGTFATPSGWTLIGSSITSTKVRIYLWWSLQSNSTLGFVYTAGTGASDISWICASFTGVDNTTPVDATGTGNSNTGQNSISVTGFNTATDDALEVFIVCNWNGSSTFTQSSFNILPALTPSNCQASLCYAKSATSPAGATGAFTVTDGAAASGNILCYQQFALRPTASSFTWQQLTDPSDYYYRRKWEVTSY